MTENVKIIITFITVCVEVSCLFRFTLGTNSGAHTSQFGSSEVSCLLRFTPVTNLRAHTLQFGSGEVSCLLRFTPGTNSGAHISHFGSNKVSCLLRFTLATNLRAHTSQFGSGGLISYWNRIRKNVTQLQRTDRESNYRGHSNHVDHWVEQANSIHIANKI